MAVAAGYEIIEFLASQGDIWDAQKDMLADTIGAITNLVIFWNTKSFADKP